MSTVPPAPPSPAHAHVPMERAQAPRWRRRLLNANQRTARGLTESGRYAFLGWIALGLFSMDPSRMGLRWGWVALNAGWISALIWWWYNRRGDFEVQRQAPRWLTAGQAFHYTLTMRHRRGPLGPWTVRDEQQLLPYGEERQMRTWLHRLNDPYQGSRWPVGDTRPTGDDDACVVALDDPVLVVPSAHGRAQVRVNGVARRRGVASLMNVRWGRTDPLGWLQAGGVAPLAHTFTVVPAPRPMPPWPSERARRAPQRREEPSRRRLRDPNGDEWAGLREARHDDPMKHTHWKSWARTGRRWVMEKETLRPTRMAIVLDPVLDSGLDSLERFERLLEMMAGQTLNARAIAEVEWVLLSDVPLRAQGAGVSAWDAVMHTLAVVQPCSADECDARWERLSSHWSQVVALRLLSTRSHEALHPWIRRWQEQGIDVDLVSVPPVPEVVR